MQFFAKATTEEIIAAKNFLVKAANEIPAFSVREFQAVSDYTSDHLASHMQDNMASGNYAAIAQRLEKMSKLKFAAGLDAAHLKFFKRCASAAMVADGKRYERLQMSGNPIIDHHSIYRDDAQGVHDHLSADRYRAYLERSGGVDLPRRAIR